MIDWTGYGHLDGHEGNEPLWERGDLVISQSTIEKCFKCAAQLGYKDDPTVVDYPSEPITYGWVLHALIALALKGELTDFWIAHPWLWGFANATFDQEIQRGYPQYEGQLDWFLGAKREAFLQGLVQAMQSWLDEFQEVLEVLNVLAIEERRYRPLGRLGSGDTEDPIVWVAGSPDMVTGGSIYDWKTANRPWAEGKGLVRIQGPLYVWLVEDLLGGLKADLHYFIWDRGKTKAWDVQTVPVQEHNVEASKRVAWQYAQMIHRGVFPATPVREEWGKFKRGWHCSAKWCPAWNACDFKGMVQDDKDLDEVRTIQTW